MITDEEYDELMKLFFSPDNTPKEQPKKNEEYKIYVAYGSNLNIAQMALRCPTAHIYGTGLLNNWELIYRGSMTGSYATIRRRKGSAVPVVVWCIMENDEKSLDIYEGYPHKYKKIAVDVKCQDKIVSGMAYVMVNSKDYNTPTEEYYQRIENGYIENGLPLEYLEQAYEKAEEMVCERIERDNSSISLFNREYLDSISNNDECFQNGRYVSAIFQR